MPHSPEADTDANFRQDFAVQVIVGVSALASTALLLIQVLPPLLRGLP